MDIVGMAFTPLPASQSPNIRDRRRVSVADTYYRSALVAFASVARWKRGEELVFVTDVDPPPMFADAFAKLGVAVLLTPFRHRPPLGFHDRFNASLYTLDAMRALSEHGRDAVLLIDPDCIAVRPLEELRNRAAKGFTAYPLRLPVSEDSNGLTGVQAGALHSELNKELSGPSPHFGGEFYGFTSATALEALEHAESAYRFALARSKQGLPKFNTEEHLLNFACRHLDVTSVEDQVRRIWTAPTYRDVRGDELCLTLWHLPSEKDRGIARLSDAAMQLDSWFWTDPAEAYRRRLGRILGVTRRPIARRAYDASARSARSVQRLIQPS